jgi:hypothetical protein
MGCPPRKRIKISGNESDKENKQSTDPNISAGGAPLQKCFPIAPPLEEDLPEAVKIQSMKVKDLRESLRTRGLSTNGLKKELQDRLLLAIQPRDSSNGPKDELMPDACISPSEDTEMAVVNGGFSSSDLKTNNQIGEGLSVRVKEDASFGNSGSKPAETYSRNESKPVENSLKSMSPSNSPHFSEEVALPATVQLTVPDILSPKKKQNTLGKIMKATTKLFSPKRNKEQTDFKSDLLAQTKETGLISAKMHSSPVDVETTATNNQLHRLPISDEANPTVNECHPPRSESTFVISSAENQNESSFTRKLSVCSTTSTSSSSSSAKIQAIRKLVREEQAHKVKDAFPTTSKSTLYQPAVGKPTGDKARFADIKEKVRVSRVLLYSTWQFNFFNVFQLEIFLSFRSKLRSTK